MDWQLFKLPLEKEMILPNDFFIYVLYFFCTYCMRICFNAMTTITLEKDS